MYSTHITFCGYVRVAGGGDGANPLSLSLRLLHSVRLAVGKAVGEATLLGDVAVVRCRGDGERRATSRELIIIVNTECIGRARWPVGPPMLSQLEHSTAAVVVAAAQQRQAEGV